MSCTRIITLAFISLELFPFDYFSIQFHVHSTMKLGTLIKHDEMMCHAKEP